MLLFEITGLEDPAAIRARPAIELANNERGKHIIRLSHAPCFSREILCDASTDRTRHVALLHQPVVDTPKTESVSTLQPGRGRLFEADGALHSCWQQHGVCQKCIAMVHRGGGGFSFAVVILPPKTNVRICRARKKKKKS